MANGGNGRFSASLDARGAAAPPRPDANGPNGGRDALGRFTRGNPGGPGNPFNRRLAAMRRAMLDAMTEESMAEAARVIQQKVREGNLAAIKLMYAYGIGKATPAVNPDRLDVEEYQLQQESVATPASLTAVVDAMPVATALTLLRGLLPVLEQRAAAQIVNVLENGPPPDQDDDSLDLAPAAVTGFRDLNTALPEEDLVAELAADGGPEPAQEQRTRPAVPEEMCEVLHQVQCNDRGRESAGQGAAVAEDRDQRTAEQIVKVVENGPEAALESTKHFEKGDRQRLKREPARPPSRPPAEIFLTGQGREPDTITCSPA